MSLLARTPDGKHARTVGLVVAAVLAGSGTAVCGLVIHRHVWRDGPVPVPWGLLLALATAVLVVRAVALVTGPPAGLGAAAGWFGTVLWLQTPGPGGDFLLVSDALGYCFLYAGMLLVAVTAVTTTRTGRNRRT